MKDIKLVIFDMDGTLFRTETVDVEAFNRALADMGYGQRSAEEILNLIGVTLDEICKVLLGSTDKDLINRFRELVIRYEEEAIATSGELYDGVDGFLHRLKRDGFTICICSNGNEEYVTSIAEKFKFNTVFDEIWYERKGISKAKAVGLLKQKFNADAFIMVGDRLCDIEAGKCNGGISVGVTYGFGGHEALMGDFSADSIEELEKLIYSVSAQQQGKL